MALKIDIKSLEHRNTQVGARLRVLTDTFAKAAGGDARSTGWLVKTLYGDDVPDDFAEMEDSFALVESDANNRRLHALLTLLRQDTLGMQFSALLIDNLRTKIPAPRMQARITALVHAAWSMDVTDRKHFLADTEMYAKEMDSTGAREDAFAEGRFAKARDFVYIGLDRLSANAIHKRNVERTYVIAKTYNDLTHIEIGVTRAYMAFTLAQEKVGTHDVENVLDSMGRTRQMLSASIDYTERARKLARTYNV